MKLVDFVSSPFTRWTKSCIAVFLASILLLPCAPQSAYADVRKTDVILGQSVDSRGLSLAQCPSIDASYAIVMTQDGTIFFERDDHAPAQIASITKIMTALLALQYADNSTYITVSANAASVGESSASLQEGDILDFDSALEGLMLSSGNDAAVAIAESIGEKISGGSVKGADAEALFVSHMNSLARELGATDTLFTNPHGLDDGGYESNQHSTAHDIAKISQAAMKNDVFRSIVATSEGSITVKHTDGTKTEIPLSSTNMLLASYEGACGVKTGFTDAAGYCFAGAANRGEGDLYAIVLDSTDENMRFEDAAVLFDWYYAHMISYTLAHSPKDIDTTLNGKTQTMPLIAEVAHSDWVDKTVKATFANPEQAIDVFDINGNVSQTVSYDKVSGDVSAGDKVGSVTFKQRNDELITVDLIASEEVKAPDIFEGIAIWWDRLFRGFSGQASEAENVLYNETPLIVTKAGAE